MAIERHKSDSRGLADHGWLNSHHTFSFANYYNPDRMGFGLLRVLNDDVVQSGRGFGTHPHENMEIISIPLSGSLRHKDSMGNEHIIHAGEVQVMSAGTGITHSEQNHSETEAVNFLQIWVLPGEQNITPRYEQKEFPKAGRANCFQQLLSPEQNAESLWINQNAYFSMIDLAATQSARYSLHSKENGLYLFIISGSIKVLSVQLSKRDGAGISDEQDVTLNAIEDAQILCMKIPLR